MKLSRAKFEQLVDDLLRGRLGPTKRGLADAGLDPSKIDEVVLVADRPASPRCRRVVKELFNRRAAQGRQPGRSGGDRRCRCKPACLAGRGQGPAAARP